MSRISQPLPLCKIATALPLWLIKLMPHHLHISIIIAATKRGAHLSHRVTFGQAVLYKPFQIFIFYIPTQYLSLLTKFGLQTGLNSNFSIIRTAIFAGLNIKAALRGDPTPSRFYPFTQKEIQTLLRITDTDTHRTNSRIQNKPDEQIAMRQQPQLLSNPATKARIQSNALSYQRKQERLYRHLQTA